MSDVWVYGTFVGKEYSDNPVDKNAYGSPEGNEGYLLNFKIDRVEAGYPEYIGEGKTVTLIYLLAGEDDESAILDRLEEGQRYFLRAYFNPNYVQEGWRFANRGLILKPLDGDKLWFLRVAPDVGADFGDPALVGVKAEIALTRENQSALFVSATKDMSAMPDMRQDARLYYLTDGRWLDRSDDLNARRVCVVHSEFANLRGLNVGDTLTLTLRDLHSIEYQGYIVGEENISSWRERPAETLELEIVGLCGMLLGDAQPTSRNLSIFIPDSVMPASFYSYDGRPLDTGSYNFVLDSSKQQDAFLTENETALAAMGFTVSFLDNNGEAYWSSVLPLQQSAAANAVVFTVVLTLTLALTTVLNFYRARREFAIQRALGIPKRKAALQFMAPMTAMGILGVGTGGALAWRFTLEKAADTLSSIQRPEGIETSAALPVAWLVLLCAGIFGLLVLFTALSAWIVARRPVLELLQGATKRNPVAQNDRAQTSMEANRIEAPTAAAESSTGAFTSQIGAQASLPKASRRFRASVRYVLRHSRRSAIKSVLVVAVALCFILALGWLNRTIARNGAEVDRQYATVVVEAEIVKNNASVTTSSGAGVIFGETIQAILDSGYIMDSYVEASAPRVFLAPKASEGQKSEHAWDDARQSGSLTLCGIENAEEFFEGTGKYAAPEYVKGYNGELFSEEWTVEQMKAGHMIPVLLSSGMMEQLGLTFGNIVYMFDDRGGSALVAGIVAGQYGGGFVSGDKEMVLLPLSALKVTEELNEQKLGYSVAKFTIDPAKNRELAAFREQMKALVTSPGAGLVDLNIIFWDEELKQVVEPLEKNLRLMAVLYPVTVAVSVLIAAGLSLLMVLQTAKEAAIMRVLGATRRKVRAMLGAEQLLLCWFGITLGFAALALTREGAAPITLAYFIYAALYFAGSVFGAALGVILITNRMPLEMLQVKE